MRASLKALAPRRMRSKRCCPLVVVPYGPPDLCGDEQLRGGALHMTSRPFGFMVSYLSVPFPRVGYG
eukprot:2782222-Alexandrium_andersonii.AAC.1